MSLDAAIKRHPLARIREPEIREVTAISLIRRMRGHAQASLLICTDGNRYVTKFHDNPQGTNVLANDWIGTALARSVGLRVPRCVRVRVSQRFVNDNPDVYLDFGDKIKPPNAGSHFGSFFLQPNDNGPKLLEHLNSSQRANVEGSSSFIGIKLFDLLTEADDRRQAVFSRSKRTSALTTTFIDFGSQFRGPSWLRHSPLSGPFRLSLVGSHLWRDRRLISFWISRFQKRLPDALESAIQQVPPEWYAGDLSAMRDHYMRRIDTFESTVMKFIAQPPPSLVQQAIFSADSEAL